MSGDNTRLTLNLGTASNIDSIKSVPSSTVTSQELPAEPYNRASM